MTYKLARRITITVVGITVIALGIVMIVTPGPAFIVIPVGLAILSVEFAWARLWLRKLRKVISNNSLNGRARRADEHRDRAIR
jgi:tellurite resistance protein TerC